MRVEFRIFEHDETIILLHFVIFYSGCYEGDIRLLEGNSPTEGRVEVCLEGAWGSVCHNGWNSAEATIACRQLGFSVTGMIRIKSLTCIPSCYAFM